MMAQWKRTLRGEVEITLIARGPQGVTPVLAALHHRGVVLARVHGEQSTCSFVLGLQDFSALYESCRANRVKIRVGGRRGVPFWLRRALARKSFFVGLALFAFTLHILGSIVWRVTISGVDGDTAGQVFASARDAGIRVGAWRPSLPAATQLQDQILKANPNLLWVGVHLNGGVARVEAIAKVAGVHRTPLPPQNIVAAKTGVIRRVFATRGQVVVQPGEVVRRGQVLVSGTLADGTVQVAAEGKATADVWYTSTVALPLQSAVGTLSGEFVTRRYVDIGGWHVRVWGFAEPHYDHQIEVVQRHDWRIGSWSLPFTWETVRVYDVGTRTFNLSVTRAEKTADQLVLQDVRAKAGRESSMLSQSVLQRHVAHGKLYETVLTQMEEDIGMASPIPSMAPSPRTPNGTAVNGQNRA